MIEVVLVLSIMTVISSVVLVSFSGLNEGAAINRFARELALATRRAQNMSLAVTQILVGPPPSTPQLPSAVGIRFSTTPSESKSVFLFADLDPRDNKYTDTSEKVSDSTILFERGIKINKIVNAQGALYATAHILFTAPEATISFTDPNGVGIPGGELHIELVAPSGIYKKTITVRESGQISIK